MKNCCTCKIYLFCAYICKQGERKTYGHTVIKKKMRLINIIKDSYLSFTLVLFQGNGYRKRDYIDRGNQFRLLIWISFIGQFVHPVGGEEMG